MRKRRSKIYNNNNNNNNNNTTTTANNNGMQTLFLFHHILTCIYIDTTDCGAPPAIENGDFNPPSRTLWNDTVTYWCNPGYEMVGAHADVKCQKFGTWETPPGCSLSEYA